MHLPILPTLEEAKLWDGNGALDWQKVVAPDMQTFSGLVAMCCVPIVVPLLLRRCIVDLTHSFLNIS